MAVAAAVERLTQAPTKFYSPPLQEFGPRGFKKGLVTSIAYFIAHESHHRGSILLTLKQCGHPVDQESRYAIWDWDRM